MTKSHHTGLCPRCVPRIARGFSRCQVDVTCQTPKPASHWVMITLLLVVGLGFPELLAASDDLQPCRDPFTTPTAAYQEEVRRTLFPERALFSSAPVARVIVLPSFEPEWSVSVLVDSKSATIELRTVGTKISVAQVTSKRKGRSIRSTMRIDQTALSKDLADRIGALWRSKLLNLGPPVARWSSDGTTLHVSSWLQGHGLLCGETVSVPGELPDTITLVTELMRALASDESSRIKLEERLREVLEEAKANAYQSCTE